MAEHDDAGITPEVWRKIVDLGWTGLLVPEAARRPRPRHRRRGRRAGGDGPRACSPARTSRRRSSRRSRPRALGLDDQLAALADGHASGARSRSTKPGYGDPIERVRVRADGRGTRYKLDGVKPMVLDGRTADWVLVPGAHA